MLIFFTVFSNTVCQLTRSCSIRQFNKIFKLAKKFTFKKSSGTGGFKIKFYLIFEGRERLSLIFCTTLYEIVSRVNCQDLRSKADSVSATLEEQLKPEAVFVSTHHHHTFAQQHGTQK